LQIRVFRFDSGRGLHSPVCEMQRDFRTSCRAYSGRVDAGGVEAHFSFDRRPSGPAIFSEFQPHAQRQSQSIVDAVRRLPGLI